VTTPDVSVVIPTRDRPGLLLHSSLPSALDQTAVDLEVIVVDDGSAEDIERLATEVGDARVRVVRHRTPLGVAAARNTGIGVARAPWIAFLDDDDLWAPTKLERQLQALSDSGASFAYCGALILDDTGRPAEVLQAPPEDSLRDEIRRRNVIPAGCSNVVAETVLLRRIGGFDTDIAFLEDWDLWIRLALAAPAVARDEVLVAYVRHPGRRLGGRTTFEAIERLRAKHGAAGFDPDLVRLLTWIAAEHRRAGDRARALEIYARTAIAYRRPKLLARLAATALDRRGHGLLTGLAGRAGSPPPIEEPEWIRRR
jgi:glycosyltransferase involved in cell wall biosynthesis